MGDRHPERERRDQERAAEATKRAEMDKIAEEDAARLNGQ
jgi:hypothetical protein